MSTTKKNKDVIFSCQRFLVQLLYETTQKWANTTKVHQIDTLLPIIQVTSILFCN